MENHSPSEEVQASAAGFQTQQIEGRSKIWNLNLITFVARTKNPFEISTKARF